jgi:hypothetical protein
MRLRSTRFKSLDSNIWRERGCKARKDISRTESRSMEHEDKPVGHI